MANDNRRGMSSVRVLVVEDFEPFLRAVRSMVGKCRSLQIVGEASDGLEAVRKAEELQPDLILLDIGLPTLDGISAARQICTLSPLSRIIFVTQESDPDIVREALNLGAAGYVVKMSVARDLLSAVDAALDGTQFLSAGLAAQEFTTEAQTVSAF
jgi:DNA-binding NarL/FixJ family response regulator